MIDSLTEQIFSLSEAAKRCPVRRGGKRTSISCLYRWTTSGCRGVVLESIQIGATRSTSREALARFFQRLTEQAQQTNASRSHAAPSSTKQSEVVEQQLDSMGL